MSADVRSFDAITQVRLALLKFADQCETALDELDSETRRMLDWLEHDRPKFWKQQIMLASDGVHQAKIDLEQCLLMPITTGRPSCREERAALERAKARLAYCHDKAERVKHWCREVQHELLEYQGRMTQLAATHEVDVPHAAAKLKLILDRLEAYRASGGGGMASSRRGAESMARPLEESPNPAEIPSDSPSESADDGVE